MGFWIFMYKKSEVHPKVNEQELAYINQDDAVDNVVAGSIKKTVSYKHPFKYRQTWLLHLGNLCLMVFGGFSCSGHQLI